MTLSDEEAQQYVVSGPYAADFAGNQFSGKTTQQTPEQHASRMAGLRSKMHGGWPDEWSQEVPDKWDPTD